MSARFFCRTGELAGTDFVIKDEATIGKAPGNTIVLPLTTVSANHARISFDAKAGAYFIEDLQSRNGTMIDGIPVVQKEKLGTLNVLTFAGDYDFIFQALPAEAAAKVAEQPKAAAPATPPAPPKPPAPVPEKPAAAPPAAMRPDLKPTTVHPKVAPVRQPTADVPAPSQPPPAVPAAAGPIEKVMLVFENPKSTFELKKGENSVGRSKDNTIYVDHAAISRHHAVLTLHRDKVTLRDAGSTNGTLVDQREITGEIELKSASTRIHFGRVEALLMIQRAAR